MQLIDRTINIINILAGFEDGLNLKDISEYSSLPNSTAFRILQSLIENNYVVQTADNKYSLSYKLLSISESLSTNNSLVKISGKYMKELAEKIDKTVALSVFEGEHIYTIYYVENKDVNMFMVKKGYPLPLFETSAGKVFLADMAYEERYERYQKNEKVLRNFEEINEELELVKIRGYAISNEELQKGVEGAACPIFDTFGNVVSAVSFTVLKAYGEIDEKMVEALKECAKKISNEIK